MLLPRTCPLCHRPGPAPCDKCASHARPAHRTFPRPSASTLSRRLAYDGSGRELVARLKYRNARTTLRWLVLQMAILLDPTRGRGRHVGADDRRSAPRTRIRSGSTPGEGPVTTTATALPSAARTRARPTADRKDGQSSDSPVLRWPPDRASVAWRHEASCSWTTSSRPAPRSPLRHER